MEWHHIQGIFLTQPWVLRKSSEFTMTPDHAKSLTDDESMDKTYVSLYCIINFR